jgi:hypothetical protein
LNFTKIENPILIFSQLNDTASINFGTNKMYVSHLGNGMSDCFIYGPFGAFTAMKISKGILAIIASCTAAIFLCEFELFTNIYYCCWHCDGSPTFL